MCGIVGYIGSRDAQPIVIDGLQKLEYRGYDSAGVAMFEGGAMRVTRAKGKLIALQEQLTKISRSGEAHVGLGHTRWATHGRPSEENAHPHTAGRVSLIHNGIVENYVELREELTKEGAVFTSETDTEIAAHLFNRELASGKEPLDAFRCTCNRLRGSFAILALDAEDPHHIFVAKTATPIVIGLGEGENFVASDIPAVLPHTRRVIILEDGDIAVVSKTEVHIENKGEVVTRQVQHVTWDPVTAQKGGFKHFMLKEIHEQGLAVSDTLLGKLEHNMSRIAIPEWSIKRDQLNAINRIVLVACGTAYYACLETKFFIESFARIPCEVDFASEFRYRQVILDERTLVIAISQSGETADTVAAIDKAATMSPTLAICNVLGSTLTRKVASTLYTHAGPEISVASTKAFSTQVVAGYLLALFLAQERGTFGENEIQEHAKLLMKIPAAIDEVLRDTSLVEEVAKATYRSKDYLFLGRGVCHPIALEGALKLKEISYIHAEGYPAGEIKHGPIALVDEGLPIVVLLQKHDGLFEKTLSNLREVESRGAQIIAITDMVGATELKKLARFTIEVPSISGLLSPLIMTVPLQLLAYHVAVLNGTDVDLPRNLAKSVTVE